MTRILELEQKIKLANEAYSIGKPYLTDEEYHKLWRELRDLDPLNESLFHTSRDPNYVNKVPHPQRILSLNKAFSSHDLRIFLQRFPSEPLELQPKLDGVALMLYAAPNLEWQAILVGDGDRGDDISWILPHCKFLPTPEQPSLSCEAVILNEDWDPSLGANQRNVVSGLLNPSRKSVGDALSRVSLIPHDSISSFIETPDSAESLAEQLLEILHKFSRTYPLDGIVLKVKDRGRRLKAGHNNIYPHWAIAWKPPIQTAETTVREIHWNVSRSGRIIPKVEYEPVQLCGTTNRFATGNNAEWIFKRSIVSGTKIVIGKAGEIIPQILEVIGSPGFYDGDNGPISKCPSCGSPLEWAGVDLICDSPNCKPQLIRRLSHFYGHFGMDLKTIGEAMIEDLLEDSDLYKTLLESPWALLDPYSFNILHLVREVWGFTRTENYLDSLEEISGSKNPAHFLSALGHPRLGYKSALSILQAYKEQTPLRRKSSLESFTKALSDYVVADPQLKNFKFSEIPSSSQITFCITGALPLGRSEVIEELASYGWKHVNSVSKNLSYLVLGDLEKETTKLRKARELGISILSPSDLPIFQP